MNNNFIMALISSPPEIAEKLARLFVEESLAACVQITPAVKSIYFWQGEICNDNEVLLFVKTRQSLIEKIKELLAKHHPYQVPELICFEIKAGNEAYLEWMANILKT